MSPAEMPVIHDKLYTLDRALDPVEMRVSLQTLAEQYLGRQYMLRDVEIDVMRRRNQRCVIRYISDVTNGNTTQPSRWRVIGKVYKANKGERTFALMNDLWRNGFSRDNGDNIRIPEPLAFSSELCILFQEEVPGEPIKDLIKRSPNVEHIRLLARTLAKLHRSEIVPGEPMTMRHHLLRCHPRYPFLALACPELEPMIDFIVDTAYQLEKKWQNIRLAPIHGDFHLGQVHIEGDRAYLVDLDALGYGDPAADLGNLMVFLKSKAKRRPEMHDLINAFLAEYFSIMDQSIARRIPIFEGITHLRRACKCLRYQAEGWRKKARKMIEKGVACMEEASHGYWAYAKSAEATANG
ncbi:MAG: phosphotransferase [candidate division KSB1 bacterium]|nr:phosphotransferase [candidate division KSB1 bacterium]